MHIYVCLHTLAQMLTLYINIPTYHAYVVSPAEQHTHRRKRRQVYTRSQSGRHALSLLTVCTQCTRLDTGQSDPRSALTYVPFCAAPFCAELFTIKLALHLRHACRLAHTALISRVAGYLCMHLGIYPSIYLSIRIYVCIDLQACAHRCVKPRWFVRQSSPALTVQY